MSDYNSYKADRVYIQYSIRNYLEELWITSPEIIGSVLYLPEAESVCKTANGISTLAYAEQHGWIEELGSQRGKIIQCRETIRRGSSVFNILSLIRIDGPEGRTLGYLSFEISQQALYDQCLAPAISTGNSFIFAVDSESRMFCVSGTGDIENRFLQASEGSRRNYFYNIEMILIDRINYIVTRSKSTNLRLAGDRTHAGIRCVVDMGHAQYTGRNLLICFILFFGLVISTVWISRAFTKPVEHLATIMNSSDPLSAELVDGYLNLPNEIGQLYRSFTDMTRNISLLMDKQKKVHGRGEAELS